MLPKRYRLTRSKDFARVRRLGRSSGSQFLVLYVLPTRSRDLRVGFSVTKRVGKAVVRNRVKRLMREAVRQNLPVVNSGQYLVFIARPASAAAGYHQIAQNVSQLLLKTRATASSSESARNA